MTLKVCLWIGDETISQNIFLNLEKLYDTTILPVDFKNDDLLWMSAMWANDVLTSTSKDKKMQVDNDD